MEPSLRDGDILLVVKSRRAPNRGQIVVAEMPSSDGLIWRVKRIVGFPGEHLSFEDGLLFINGRRHPEPYLRGLPAYLGLDSKTFDVGERHYFLLGDNRAHSDDSRNFGSIEAVRIAGVAKWLLWPPLRARFKLA